MKPSNPLTHSRTARALFACLVSFNILITPVAAIAGTYKKPEFRSQKAEPGSNAPVNDGSSAKSAVADIFAKPLGPMEPAAPAAVPAPAPMPAAPPVGSVTSSLTASLLVANGGVDADSDGKADPGDTIAYTLSLANTSGAGATGLAIANPLDSHTTLVPGSLNSTPVAFDQTVTTNEDIALQITISGQDPDGSNLTFKDGAGNPFGATTNTTHGQLGAFSAPTCDAAGVCSSTATYTPAANYNGPDSFTFKVNDGTSNSNENGTVSITVNAVNDAPTFTVPGNPAAVNEDAGAQTVTNYISGIRPAQSGNTTEDTQTVSLVVTNVTHSALFSAQPTLTVSNSGNSPFPLTANLTYTPAANANGTSVVTYHLHDNGGTANSGVDNSADQTFTITVNAVNDAPVAVNTTATVQANMKITGLAVPLTTGNGVTDADVTNSNNDSLSADRTFFTGTPAAFTVTAGSIVPGSIGGSTACANTGTVSNVNTTNGTFDYDPPPGFTGTCTLVYTITDNGNPGTATSAAAKITLTINGPVIWFVDPTRTNDGNGTLSNTSTAAGQPGPFKLLASANAQLATLATNQKVFIYTGTFTTAGTEVLDLKATGDWAVGQGTVATNFDTFFGVTPPAGTIARPTLASNTSTANGMRPTVKGTITMRNATQVTGLNIDVTAGSTKGIQGIFTAAGTSLVSDVNVSSAGGNAVDVSGTQTFTYVTSDASNSPNTISSTAATGLSVVNTTIGAGGLNFRSISVGGASDTAGAGIILDTTGSTGSLTVSGTGSAGTGGTIQHKNGADINTVNTDGTLNLTGTTGTGIFLRSTKSPSFSWMALHDFSNFAIVGSGLTGLTLNQVITSGVNGSNPNVHEGVMNFDNVTTSASITNTTIAGGIFNNFSLINTSGTLNRIVFDNCTFGAMDSGNTNGNDSLFIQGRNSATVNVTVQNTTMTSARGDMFQVDLTDTATSDILFKHNTVNNQHPFIGIGGGGLVFSGGGTTGAAPTMTYDVGGATAAEGNTFRGAKGDALLVVFQTGHGTSTGKIRHNSFGVSGVDGSGASQASDIEIRTVGRAAQTVLIDSNTILQYGNNGVLIQAGDNSVVGTSGTVGDINATISNNTISEFSSNPALRVGVHLNLGTTASPSDTTLLCADVLNNNAPNSGSEAGNSSRDYEIRQRQSTTMRLPGYGGTSSDIAAVASYIQGRNVNGASSSVFVATPSGGGGYLNTVPAGSQCVQPVLPSGAMFKPAGSQQQQFFALLNTLTGTNESQNAPASSLALLSNATSLSEVLNYAPAATAPVSAIATGAQVGETLPVVTTEAQIGTATVTAAARVGAVEPSVSRVANIGNSLASFANAFTEVFEPTAHAEEARGLRTESSRIGASVTEASGVRLSHATAEARGLKSNVSTDHAREVVKGQTSEVRSHTGAAPLVPTPIGQFPINGTGTGAGFTLPDGKTITIKFKATLNTPPALSGPVNPKVTAQATLTGSFVGNPLVSDDPSVGGTTDPTSTTVDLYDSTTTLSASPSNSTNTGQAVTFTATIGTSGTPDGSATNRTGTVNFKDNGASIGCDSQTVSHVGSNDVATCTTSSLSTGSHTNITAAYSGDGNFDPSTSSAFTQTVSKSGTNATLTSSLNPSVVTQTVTFTATITTATSVPNPTGTVNFKDGATTISGCGSQALNGSGVATCATSTLTAGNHTITADYSGDTQFNANSGIVLSGGSPAGTQTVNKATPTVTLVSSTNPAFVSQNVTFTATVTAPAGISATPTGTLTFKDGGVAMTCTGGNQFLSAGVATCQKNNLSAGSHTITVDYPTDANFNAVSGTAMTANAGQNGNPQVVNQSNTTMTVSSSLNPSKVTESVKFTVNIISSNLGSVPGPPTGQVKFWDGPANTGTQIGVTKTLGSGGTCNANSACVDSDATTTLTAGTHTITVEYLGDTNFSTNAQTLSGGQVVNKSDTTTTITNNTPNPSTIGGLVTITAHVASSGVTFDNTGTVAFKDGASTIGGCSAQPINGSGDATCSTTALPAGARSLTAVYSGNATFNTSTSASASQQVGPTCSSSIVVTDSGDSGPNTLRQAIADICDGGTITFAPAVTAISLVGASGDLHITKNMTITGPGSAILSISGASQTRIYEVDASITVNITGMTLNNGNVTGANGTAGGPGASAFGGGISNTGTLNLTDVTVNNCQAKGGDGDVGSGANTGGAGGEARGGGIYNIGTLTLTNSTVSNSSATGGKGGDSTAAAAGSVGGFAYGGGVYNGGTSLTLTGSTISANTVTAGAAGANPGGPVGTAGEAWGGGVLNLADASPATAVITNSTISNNAGQFGGGIRNFGNPAVATLTITGSTISGNTAAEGGGIHNRGTVPGSAPLSITNSTFSGNSVTGNGGGLHNDSDIATLTGVTITGNRADSDNDTVGNGGGINQIGTALKLQDTIVAGNFKGTGSGIMQQETGTVVGSITSGTQQIDVLTVAGGPVATCSGSGTIQLTVTAAGMTGSGTPVSVTVNETDSAAQVTTAIFNFLTGGGATNITNFFTVTQTGATELTFTRKAAATNDLTMSVAIGDGSCTGITSTSDSTTTPGASSGNAKVTVTAAGLPGGTKTLSVPVAKPDTQDDVASKIRASLAADTDINSLFSVTGGTNQIILTKLVAAPNDPTLNIATDNDTCTGLTPQPTSADTTGGAQAEAPNDIAGTVDATSSYDLIGNAATAGGLVDVTTDAAHKNQVGNGGSGTVTTSTVLDVNLANNGGPTRTHKLAAGSPAIDTGNSFTMTTDQRGLQRPVDLAPANVSDGADIGAYEQQGATPVPTLTLTSANSGGTTRDTTPDFQAGSLVTGATVELLRDDDGVGGNPPAVVFTTTATGATTPPLTDGTLTTDGNYLYSVRQTVGGDAQTSTPALSVIVDTRTSTPDLLTADDTFGPTGTNTDNITQTTSPTFTGTADLNTTIRLFADGNLVGTTTSDNVTGAWSITSSPLSSATHSITAKEVIGAFVGAPSTALSVTIDTTVAPPSTPVLLPADDSGAADNITNKTTPTFTGTAEANSAIQLLANGNPVGAGSADGSGNWSVASSTLSDGTYLITAVATDVAGNVSTASGALSVTIDTQVGAPSAPDLITADDSGTFNNDNVTNKNTPTFTGTAEADSNVKVFADSGGGPVQVGSGTATGGNWSITTSLLADNTYQITATATDTAGNVSVASAALSVTIDTTPPGKPLAPDLIAADDSGASNTDNITKITTPTFTGTAETGANVDLFKDSGGGPVSVGTGTAGGGNWTIISSALTDNTYQMTVVATDLAGNPSVSSDPLSVTIDTVPPIAPSTPVLSAADDTGTSSSDGITKKNTPNFTGTAEPNSTVQLFAGATPVGSGLANGAPGGTGWSIISGLLPDNSYNVTAQATDLAGNPGPASGAFALVIDTVKPTVTMSSAVGNPTATTPIPVTVVFSEPVFGFVLGDITASNGTTGNFAGSNANYSFDLTPTAAGGVSADIAADVATDTAGNGNTAAVQFNRTYDPSALNATITPISPNPRNTAVSSIQIVFNKAVTGFDLSDLTLKLNNGANLLTGAQTLNSADNATWTLGNLAGITAAEGTYDLKLTAAGSNIQDSTSTALAADATASWVTDTTPPTVTVEQVGPDPVTGPSGTTIINFTATFSEPVTGLTAGGVAISGTANPTLVNVTGSGTTYNLAVQGMTQTGTVIATVNAAAAIDSAGNGNAASTSVDNTVQYNKDNVSTLEVNSTADTDDGSCDPLGTGPGNQDCTLREAINAANADFGAETITFNSTVFAAPGPYTINLTGALPDITGDVTISGPGAKVLTVKRNTGGNYRIFTVNAAGVNLTIDGLTINNGNVVGLDGGGVYYNSTGTLTITNSAISGNSTDGSGGGLYAGGTLNLINTTISGNTASQGGGVELSGISANISNSTISGNSANLNGGGIQTILAGLTATITDSTITGNRADNDTNGSGTGGGIFRTGGTVILRGSIVAANYNDASPSTTPDDIGGTLDASSSYNLIGTGLSGGLVNGTNNNQVGVADPGLNPLTDNGGPTMTHSLLCTSPAIDKGNAFGLTSDQRGGTRPFDFSDSVYPNAAGGDGSDIGAYEAQGAGGCLPTAVPPSPAPSTNEDTPVIITLKGTYSQNVALTFSITQNPTIGGLGAISAPNCVFNLSMTCTATVTYTPNANVNGADLFKFRVSAGGLDSDPADVPVTVNATNDPPSFLQAGNQTVLEDAGPQSVPNFVTAISAGPPDESGQTVQFIVTNNTNPGLFSAAPAIDGAGTLTFTSAPNANGSASITMVAKDNGGGTDTSAPQTFTIDVLSVNDAPSFTLGADPSSLEDAGAQSVANFASAISAGPPQESGQTVQFIITNNSNPGLFSSAPAISPTGTLTYKAAPDANGSAAITVVLKDNGGTANGGSDTSAPATFNINVISVNDAPTLNPLNSTVIDEDAAPQIVNLSGITAGGGETQTLTVTATSSDPLLIPNPTVTYASPNATGSISFQPVADQSGSAIITVTVKDNGGTSNGGVDTFSRQFQVTVNAVDDPPVNHVPGPQIAVENTPLVFSAANGNQVFVTDVDNIPGPMKVTLTATNGVITLGTISGLSFTVGDGTADPTMTFTANPGTINAALQNMSFIPANGFAGSAALLIVSDDLGRVGSGGPLTDTDNIPITVQDGGALQLSAPTYSVAENNGPAVITINRAGGTAGTATVQIATSAGTATAGSDYTAVSQTVTFGPGETTKTVNIPITNDLINESNETVEITLSNAGGSGALGLITAAELTITDDDPAGGYLKFSSPTYSVAEGGVATITVQRLGTITQAVTVEFATTDNSDPAAMVPCGPTPGNTLASSRCDFSSAFGRLSWAAGDGADKTFTVMTTQDSYVEGPETLTLTLSNLSASANFSGPSTATLTINDDAVEPPTNSIDDTDTFVEQQYRDFLNRPSDPSGKAFWINNINHCNDPAQRPPGQTAAQCIQVSRVVTAGAFFLSIEFQATGGTAYLTNKVSFGSVPNFSRFERDAQQIGQNYVFGQPGAEAILEANKVAYYNDYVARTEFVNTYAGVSNQQYVDTLITNTGVSFTTGERNQLVNGLNNNTETRATVLRKISEKPAFRTAEFNTMFVLMEYFGFLRRNPDQAGFNFWLNKLNAFNGDYFAAEMVKAFIESGEYRQRFGP